MNKSARKDGHVFLLGLNNNHYGIIRNVHRHVQAVHVFAPESSHLGSSRLPFRRIPLSLEAEPKAVLTKLIQLGESLDAPKLIVPACDRELHFVAEHAATLGKHYALSMPRSEVLGEVMDKYRLQELLSAHDIAYPRTVLIDRAPTHEMLGSITFPCIVKPAFSAEWKTSCSSRAIGEVKATVCESAADVAALYDRVKAFSPRLIAQRIIQPKEDKTYSYCCYSGEGGKVLFGFVTSKILQYPKGLGTALMCRSVENEAVSRLGRHVVESIGLDGIAEVEVIQDALDGRHYVIEINPRHWMQHAMSGRLGVNFSLLDCHYRLGRDDEARALLAGPETRRPVAWFDDVGFLIHAAKNLFVKDCHYSEMLGCAIELSLFSVRDPWPFISCLKSKLRRRRGPGRGHGLRMAGAPRA